MAATPVRVLGSTAAKTETTPGTYLAPAPATEGFLTYQSPDPFDHEFRSSAIEHDTGTYTALLDIPGVQLAHPSFQFAIMGGGAATTPARWAPIMRCCGLVQTVGASDVTYKVPASATATVASASVVSDTDGIQVQSAGVIGQSMTISGSAGGPITCQFTGIGLKRPTRLTGETDFITWTGWTGGTDRAKQFLSNNLSTIVPGGTASPRASYAPIGFGFTLNFNLRPSEVISYNAAPTLGLHSIILAAFRPTIELFIAADKETAAGNTMKPSQIEADIGASLTSALHFEFGSSTAGEIVQLDIPKAQPLRYTKRRQGDVLGWAITYKVQHDTPGSEIVLTTK